MHYSFCFVQVFESSSGFAREESLYRPYFGLLLVSTYMYMYVLYMHVHVHHVCMYVCTCFDFGFGF